MRLAPEANREKRPSLHGIKLWTDYRVMFDKIGKEILDAVLIATPEHNHYTISTYFIRRGKHVYRQKPLCHTVVPRPRMLVAEAKKQPKVITQMGAPGPLRPQLGHAPGLGAGGVGRAYQGGRLLFHQELLDR